jgi:hypothetical protein
MHRRLPQLDGSFFVTDGTADYYLFAPRAQGY